MRRSVRIYVLPVLALACWSAWAAEKYACQANVFMWDAYAKHPVVWSPDHSRSVRLWASPEGAEPDHGHFYASVFYGSKRLKTIELKELSAGTFVKWAPDSHAFYVMWSNGGAIGWYQVRAFIVSDDSAVESKASKNVAADFAQHHSCKARGENLYAVQWSEG